MVVVTLVVQELKVHLHQKQKLKYLMVLLLISMVDLNQLDLVKLNIEEVV